MSATVRITVTDNDGPEPELVYIVDHYDTFDDAVDEADALCGTWYSQTGVPPRLPDGTPYWGESDENEVNQ